MKWLIGFLALPLLASFETASAQAPVTTYIIQTQEKRESTRWTLTEWMRIKERMKMMDVWLAMNSNSKNDSFAPELNFTYENRRGLLAQTGINNDSAIATQQGTAQLFLTNILSSTVGVRLLNIDLGFEGGMSQSQPVSVLNESKQDKSYYYAGDLRIFGRHIQDSSIVLRLGKYQTSERVSAPLLEEDSYGGLLLGGALRLYFTPWLGVEGSYTAYGTSDSLKTTSAHSGQHFDYKAFVEVAVIRLSFGVYQERWKHIQASTVVSADRGYVAGLSLLL